MNSVNFSAGYVCGVICSDGKVVWNEKYGNYSVSLETKNKEFAGLFSENLSKLIEKEPRMGTHKRKKNGNIVHMNTVTVYGKGVIENLISRWGFTYGTRTWSVPQMTWDDKDFRMGFIMGFCDGNGSVSTNIQKKGEKKVKKRSLRLYSVNRRGLADLRRLLEYEGIKSMFYQTGECFTINISGKTRLQNFKDCIGFGLTSKKRSLDDALLPLSLS